MAGLMPEQNTARDKNFLTKSQFAVGYNGSLSSIPDLGTDQFQHGLTTYFPFPQVKQCARVTFLFTHNAIYRLENGTLILMWTGNEYDAPWTVADFTDYILLSNGFHLLEYIVPDGTIAQVTHVSVPAFNASCNYNGQLFISADGGKRIQASKIGELQFALDEQNMQFTRPVDFSGTILRMCKLGRTLYIFGTDGIDAMRPTETGWSYSAVASNGLLSTWSLVEAEGKIWFIDSRCHLVMIDEENGFTDVGYQMYFSNEPIVLSWDPKFKLLYISGHGRGYAYNPVTESLGTSYEQLTAVTHDRIITFAEYADVKPFEIHTNWYDFGARGYKTLHRIEFSIAVDNAEEWSMSAALDFRVHNNKQPRSTPWKRVNPDGIAWLACYGLEFKIKLRSEIPQQRLHLDNIRVIGTIHGYNFLNAIGWAPNANAQ